eukprot:808730-Prymnesium_polylepis.1
MGCEHPDAPQRANPWVAMNSGVSSARPDGVDRGAGQAGPVSRLDIGGRGGYFPPLIRHSL